jgi:hypothetical protein
MALSRGDSAGMQATVQLWRQTPRQASPLRRRQMGAAGRRPGDGRRCFGLAEVSVGRAEPEGRCESSTQRRSPVSGRTFGSRDQLVAAASWRCRSSRSRWPAALPFPTCPDRRNRTWTGRGTWCPTLRSSPPPTCRPTAADHRTGSCSRCGSRAADIPTERAQHRSVHATDGVRTRSSEGGIRRREPTTAGRDSAFSWPGEALTDNAPVTPPGDGEGRRTWRCWSGTT